MPHSVNEPTDHEHDIPGQGVAVAAEALYLINLLLLPVVGFIALLILYFRNIAQAPMLAFAICVRLCRRASGPVCCWWR